RSREGHSARRSVAFEHGLHRSPYVHGFVAASLLLVRLRDARARERGTGVTPEAPAGAPSVGVAISLRWKSEQVAHALADERAPHDRERARPRLHDHPD